MPFWGGPDRRTSVRVQLRITVRVELQGQPRFYEAISRDLSLSGARLLLHHQLDHCTPVTLQFRLPDALHDLYLSAHVVWSHDALASLDPKKGRSFAMGIEFVDPPREARRQLKAFVADRLKKEPERPPA